MDRKTGAPLDTASEAHLAQSIADILTTPVGSRVARRDYGSLLPELLDQPVTRTTVLKLYAATAAAIGRWEPRIRLKRVSIATASEPGRATLTLEGERTDRPGPSSTRLSIPITRSL